MPPAQFLFVVKEQNSSSFSKAQKARDAHEINKHVQRWRKEQRLNALDQNAEVRKKIAEHPQAQGFRVQVIPRPFKSKKRIPLPSSESSQGSRKSSPACVPDLCTRADSSGPARASKPATDVVVAKPLANTPPTLEDVLPQLHSPLASPGELRESLKLIGATSAFYKGVFDTPGWQSTLQPGNWKSYHALATGVPDPLNKFHIDLTGGFALLSTGKSRAAFLAFDRAFNSVSIFLRGRFLQFLTYLFDLMIGFEGPSYLALIDRLLRFMAQLARIMLPHLHPFIQILSSLILLPESRARIAENLLSLIVIRLQHAAGADHPDSVGALCTLAWVSLHQGAHTSALMHFQSLLSIQILRFGNVSIETCFALLGLSEAHLRLGQLIPAQRHLEEVLRQTPTLEPTQQAHLSARALRSLSHIAQSRAKYESAKHLMQRAIETAEAAYGPDSGLVNRTRLDMEVLERRMNMRPIGEEEKKDEKVYQTGRLTIGSHGAGRLNAAQGVRACPTVEKRYAETLGEHAPFDGKDTGKGNGNGKGKEISEIYTCKGLQDLARQGEEK